MIEEKDIERIKVRMASGFSAATVETRRERKAQCL